jgi:hypothetical protein
MWSNTADALAQDRDEIEAGAGRAGHHEGDADGDPAVGREAREVLFDEAAVDDLTREGGDNEGGDGGDQQETDGEAKPPGVAQHERGKPLQRLEPRPHGLGLGLGGGRCRIGGVGGAGVCAQGAPDIGGRRERRNQRGGRIRALPGQGFSSREPPTLPNSALRAPRCARLI